MNRETLIGDLDIALSSIGKSFGPILDWELYDPFDGNELHWDGEKDDPRFAWALLDILDQAKSPRGERVRYALGVAPGHLSKGESVPRADGMTHYCASSYGRTRTEAIALWFLQCYETGVLPKVESTDVCACRVDESCPHEGAAA